MWTISDVLADHPNGELFLVKIDIEGFESDLFATNTGWVDSAKGIFIEPHDWMMPGRGTSRAFRERLAREDLDLLVVGENLLYVRPRPG